MSLTIPSSSFLCCIFYKKAVRWRIRKKLKLRVRHEFQQDSSIKGNYSAALEIHQKKNKSRIYGPHQLFWMNQIQKKNLSSGFWKKEQYLVMCQG